MARNGMVHEFKLTKPLEMRGVEPRTFHMRSERSTTELHPRRLPIQNAYFLIRRVLSYGLIPGGNDATHLRQLLNVFTLIQILIPTYLGFFGEPGPDCDF